MPNKMKQTRKLLPKVRLDIYTNDILIEELANRGIYVKTETPPLKLNLNLEPDPGLECRSLVASHSSESNLREASIELLQLCLEKMNCLVDKHNDGCGETLDLDDVSNLVRTQINLLRRKR